jgi:hypothetical protein
MSTTPTSTPHDHSPVWELQQSVLSTMGSDSPEMSEFLSDFAGILDLGGF